MAKAVKPPRTDNKKQDVLAEQILRAAGLSSDDLMAFQHVFRDAASNLCTRLGLYTAAPFIADVQTLETLKTTDLGASLGSDTLVAALSADRWGGDVLFVLEANLVNMVTDAFFGSGDPGAEKRNGRPFSPVEITVGEKFVQCLAAAINDIFGAGDTALFELKSLVPVRQFDAEDFSHARMFCCEMTFAFEATATQLRILLPRSCHRPIQEAVTRMLRTPSNRSDPLWARRLRQEVSRAHIDIEAYAVQGSMTLKSLSELSVGQVLPLPVNMVSQVRLRSGEKPLYKCSLGKIGTNFSVRVSDFVDEEEEMIDELVHG